MILSSTLVHATIGFKNNYHALNSLTSEQIVIRRAVETMDSLGSEVLEERSELIRNIVEEALEDIGMSKAIQEGEASELATRGEVFNLLEDRS